MIQLRRAKAEDVTDMLRLVMELAIYEKAPEEVINTEARMLKEGFGENPVFGCILAEEDTKVVGLSIYYYRYSTWKGKRIYLEDLIVTESKRGKGIGKLLFDKVIEIGKETNCSGMMWQVLDWNEPAINFYKNYPTRFDEGWLNAHLDF